MAKKKTRKTVEKSRLTINMSVPLIERVKNAVYWTPGLTMSSLTEKALLASVNQLEKDRGAAFLTREHELRPGRPVL